MSTHSVQDVESKDGVSVQSNVAASDEERSSRQYPSAANSESRSSSSSEDEEGIATPPPNKRRKYHKHIVDPRIDSLINQVNYISGYLTQLPHYITSAAQNTQNLNLPGPSNKAEQPLGSHSQYLINPCSSTNNFQLGDLSTDFDEKRVIPPAKKERLDKIRQLQHFDTQAWKGMRYKSVLQGYSATPGFVALKVNEELCHFNKTKDFLASAENMLAGLSNAELEQQELLKQGLQDLLNWAAANPATLNPTTLFEKVSGLLGTGSPLHKCSEKIMQIICGRRGECIEIRRERIVKEINSPMLKATLRDIPPSAEYLFSRQALLPVIQSLGGTQSWLNKPEYIKEKPPIRSKSSAGFKHEKRQIPLNNFNNKNTREGVKQNNFKNNRAQKHQNFRGTYSKRNNTEQNNKQK